MKGMAAGIAASPDPGLCSREPGRVLTLRSYPACMQMAIICNQDASCQVHLSGETGQMARSACP